MNIRCSLNSRAAVLMAAFLLTLTQGAFNPAQAHCDTLDGPVVKAARQALADGKVDSVLIWVQSGDEEEIKAAFQKALAVRNLSPAAKDLADQFFFETLVRVHRHGEGAPFTGLKPAGADLGPAVPAGDIALETGKIELVEKLLTDAVRAGLHKHFSDTLSKKNFDAADIAAGREYVRAYVEYIHYVEWVYEGATEPSAGHYPEAAEGAHKD